MAWIKQGAGLQLEQDAALDEQIGHIISHNNLAILDLQWSLLLAVQANAPKLNGKPVGIDALKKPSTESIVNLEGAFENLASKLLLGISAFDLLFV